jgi:hypothetical protein
MANKKKPKKRHPHVTRAITRVEKLRKQHQEMALHLGEVKKSLMAMPFDMPFNMPHRS